MENNYVVYHLHSDISNGVTSIDSVTKFTQYVQRAKECGMKALAFSEHGSVMNWLNKTIQNWKVLFYCFGNERYYEATFNGDKDELYLDRYNLDHKKVFKVTEGEI